MPAAGQIVRASDVGFMTAFTPTWSGLTTGTSATNEGYYSRAGDLVFWQSRLVFGTSPTITGTVVLTNLPINPWSGSDNGLQNALGYWIFRDTSATLHYGGTCGNFGTGTTEVSFAGAWHNSTDGDSFRINASGPGFTVAVGDILTAGGTFKAA